MVILKMLPVFKLLELHRLFRILTFYTVINTSFKGHQKNNYTTWGVFFFNPLENLPRQVYLLTNRYKYQF